MEIRFKRGSTIFSSLLNMLGVKHTGYADRLFNEHPYKYSFYGLSKMLSSYNIPNAGIEVKDKDSGLDDLDVPFVAHTGDEFVLVYKKDKDRISYLWNDKYISLDIPQFKKIWSGYILLAEPDKDSCELNYKSNYRLELLDRLKYLFLTIFSLVFIVTLTVGSSFVPDGYTITLLLSYIIGGYVCVLLLMKQLHIESRSADKICSVFTKGDCNTILEQKESKLLGIISWSEVGVGYFVSNIIILLLFPNLICYMAVIGYCSLFFCLWSIWYQIFKVKQICTLCMIVQSIFIFLSVIYYCGGFVNASMSVKLDEVILILCIYIVPPLAANVVCAIISRQRKYAGVLQMMNGLKMKDEVVSALLKKQTHYEAGSSSILFGNRNAKTRVTVLTNPHCEPCAVMHRRINKLLEKVGDRICVEYVFTSFSRELDDSSRKLIAVYLHNDIKRTAGIYNEWFAHDKYDREGFFARHSEDIGDAGVEAEFARHVRWKENSKLTATPTVLVNGYKLPREYKIENVEYFVDIENL